MLINASDELDPCLLDLGVLQHEHHVSQSSFKVGSVQPAAERPVLSLNLKCKRASSFARDRYKITVSSEQELVALKYTG